MHVLLLGDYPPLLKALKWGLEEEGIRVAIGGHLQEADPSIPGSEYDAIILDLVRPAFLDNPLRNGKATSHFHPPILVLAPEDVHPSGPSQVPRPSNWLAKPFTLEEVLSRLRALVNPAPWGPVRRESPPAPPLARSFLS
jgi:DNA-binding response OmpR family regulator